MSPELCLYERHGFVVEGTLRRDAFRDGAYADVQVMARIRTPEGGPATAPGGE